MKRMLMMFFLLFGLLCQAAQKTVVVFVNGIGTTLPEVTVQTALLRDRWIAYAQSKGIPTTNYPTFVFSHNQHTWWLGDLTEATRQFVGQYGTDLTKYFGDQSLVASASDNDQRQLAATEVNTPGSQFNATMLALDSTKSSTPASLYTPLNDAINRMSQADRTDLSGLVAKLKSYIQQPGNKTVCLGHSQGNFYCNLAYQVIQRDYAGTSYALPNNNVLEVVAIATPASYTADGRFQYVTYCRDIINMTPYSLNANYKNPAELAPCMPRSTSFTSNLASSVAGLISFIINGTGYKQHLIDHYLGEGSGQLDRVMRLLEDTLTGPGCGGNSKCYLKDDFRGAGYDSNWQITKLLGGNSYAKTIGGILEVYSENYWTTVQLQGESTLRTRRVFTGPFKADLQFQHRGPGLSVLSLKKVDGSTVLALVVNSVSNIVSAYPSSLLIGPQTSGFSGWHKAGITKTNTQTVLSVDGVVWAVNTSGAMDGYYLEISSQGYNTLWVRDFLVMRSDGTAITISPPPPPPPPALVPVCSANPGVILAGQSTVFTGSYSGGIPPFVTAWGGVVSGSGSTAVYSTTASMPAGFGKATFSVTDSGSPKQIAVASCQVQINAQVIPVTGTVGISASKDGSVYTGSLSCVLTTPSGQQAIGSVPATLNSQATGNYSLSCTAPANTAITGISPSAAQTLSGGGTVNFAVGLKTVQTIQPLSNVTCQVSAVSIVLGQKVTYTASWSGGSGSPGFNWTGYISGTTRSVDWIFSSPGTYTASVLVMDNGTQISASCPAVTVTQATVTVYANPLPTPPAGVYWTWSLSAWQSSGSSWITQPVLNLYGTDYRFSHPAGYIEALKQIKAWGASGPLDQCISEFQAVLPYWPPYVVVGSVPAALTVTGYYWNTTPLNRVKFSGNISGTGLASGMAVYFCVNNTGTCYQHPVVGVAVNSPISLSVYEVDLTTGYWQAEVRALNGAIARGPAFYVQ